ncbi:hypothetical protein IC582_016629 [Cucumis melo]
MYSCVRQLLRSSLNLSHASYSYVHHVVDEILQFSPLIFVTVLMGNICSYKELS